MRFLALMVLILLGTVHLAFSQCPNALYEDFETGGFQGTTSAAGGTYTQTFPATGAAQGNTHLRNTGGGTSNHYEGILQTFTPSQPGYISFYVRSNNTNTANSYVIIGDANVTTNNGMFWCYFSASGVLRITDGVNFYDAPTVANAWFHVEMRNINWTTYTYDAYINGSQVGANIPFRSGAISNVDRIYLYNFNGTQGDYDQIIIGSQPISLTANVGTIACNGGTTNIDLTASNGASPYSFSWSNGANTEDLTAVAAGTYTVTVTDGVGCTATNSYTIAAAPSAISVTATVNNATFCGGTGDIDITVSGGTPGYTYAWSNGATSEDLTAAIQGTYGVTITDANGCTATGSYTIGLTSNVLFTENFETGGFNPSNSWVDLSSGGYTATFPSSGAPQGNYYFNSAGSSGHDGGWEAAFTAGQPTEMSWYMRTDNVTSANNYFLAGDASIDVNNCVLFCYFTSSSDLRFFNGSIGFNLPITVNTWYFVEIKDIDWTNRHFDVYVDGSLILTDFDFRTTTANDISKLHLYNLNPANANYDDIIIGSGSQLPTLSATVGTISCNGGTTDIDLTVNNASGSQTYTWSNGATTEDLTGVVSGTYSVTVDDGGCTVTDSYTIASAPSAISVTETVNDATCGSTTGDINLTVSGGTPAYSLLWSNGSTSEDLTGVSPGTYTVTVTDGNSCTFSNSYTINSSPALGLSATVGTILCNGGTTDIDLTVTGNTGAPVFTWSSGQTTEDISGLVAGTYSVTVVDGACSATGSYTIAAAPSAITVTPIVNDAPCNGGVGDITLNTSGGTPGYTFVWSNGGNTNSITAVAPGTYDATITDANGCSVTGSYTIAEPAAISASAVVTDVDCNGNANGEINLTVSGGTPGYTYLWSNGAVIADPTGLSGGTYDVTITDANSCTFTASYTVAEPTALLVTPAVLNPSCYGGTGNVEVIVSGGTAGYTYNWSNGNNTNTVTAVTAGTYDVTVTDANGCSFADSYTVVEPDSISLSETITDAACFGGTGDILLNVSGGTPGYTYNWSNGNNTNSLTAVLAGTYDVTVTDANGCFKTATYNISQPAQINVNPAITTPLCHGGTGSIVLNVVGGTAPYGFNWSNGNNTNSITGVTAGNYTVTITDANSCTFVNTYNLQQPAEILVNAAVSDASCNNGRGDILLYVSGGTGAYSINWSTGATSFSLISVPAGTYGVTITDANGCVESGTYTINQPTQINVTASVTNALCNGGTGDIVLTTTGGQGTYTYNWSNGNNTSSLTAVAPGGYGVTVTDTSGCSFNGFYQVLDPDTIRLTASVSNAACYGGTGDITLTAAGGTPGYTYNWSSGNNTNSLTAVVPGAYSVTVTDVNGCSNTGSYNVTEPAAPLDVTILGTTLDSGNVEGSVLIDVAGGTAPYSFSWSNGENTQNLNGVATGMYYVTVTDDAGCIVSDSAFVDLFVGLENIATSKPAHLDVWPNPFEHEFSIALNDWIMGDVEITLFDANGRMVFNQNIQVTGLEQQVTIREYLSSGIYFLNVHNDKTSMTRKLIRE